MTAATDPKFTNAGAGGLKFRLQADSPAIDRGAVIPGVTDGHTGTVPDLGGYEYGGTDWVAGSTLGGEDVTADSPVKFPKEGALPAKHPPDEPSRERNVISIRHRT